MIGQPWWVQMAEATTPSAASAFSAVGKVVGHNFTGASRLVGRIKSRTVWLAMCVKGRPGPAVRPPSDRPGVICFPALAGHAGQAVA